MQFRQAAEQLALHAGVGWAQQAIRAAHGRHAARWLADQAGIAPRTARRWLSNKSPRGRAEDIRQAAREGGLHGIAAVLFGAANAADLGFAVEVNYFGQPQGTRGIGYVEFRRSYEQRQIVQCAEDLARADWAGAADAFGNAVLSAYGGLQDTLTITDYPYGITLYH